MKKIITYLIALICSIAGRAQSVVYLQGNVTSTYSNGYYWGLPGNQDALNAVFGTGNWQDLKMETANVASILVPSVKLIFIDGSNFGTCSFINFLNSYHTDLENWVNAGGSLILNAAPNECSNSAINLYFGGTALPSVSSVSLGYYGYIVNTNHPIFQKGIFQPSIANQYYGSALAHTYVTGTDLSNILTNESSQPILSEKTWGQGHVIFGGLTLAIFEVSGWTPQPNVFNFYKNVLQYAFNLGVSPLSPQILVNGQNSPGSTCSGQSVSFDASGTTGGIPPYTYGWDFNGDAIYTDATTPTASYTYNGPVGTVYSVCLKVTDASGATKFYCTTVTIANCNNISTSSLSSNVICVGGTQTVSFTSTGTYNVSNVFTAQLSDASGSFATPVNIGTLVSTANGTINATIPTNTTAGTGYRIRVVSNNPAITGSDNGSNITVNAIPAASVSAGGPTTFCPTGSVVLTSAVGDSYLWSTGATTSAITVNSSGSYFVKITTNGCSATSEATSVTVEDNTKPTVVTQNITVQLDASGAATITPAQINNNSTDNCTAAANLILALDKTSFDCSNVSANTVTLKVTDANGNSQTGTATVTVKDEVKPTVVTQNITVQLDANGAATITPAQINKGSTDNCTAAADLTFGLDKTNFDCSNVGANTVTLTVTDANGNSQIGTATVTVEDKIKPTVVTQNITVQLDASGAATITPAQINNGSTDNCTAAANLTLALDKTTFDCSDIGDKTVTLTVTDANGNAQTGTATVTLEDKIKPKVVTQDITVQLDASGGASITPSQINDGSTDNCSIPSDGYSLSKTTFDCSNVGANTVTLTVTDANGNSETGTATVTVEDKIKPTVHTQNITVQLDASGAATITPAQIDNGSSDNCTAAAGLTLALDKTSFDCSNVGANTVTLTVTDANGNSQTGTATVTVKDEVKPTVVTQNITVQLDANGAASITPVQINNGSTDNCTAAADLQLALDKTTFDCSNIGDNTVTLTVTDANGNSQTGTATVTIEDKIKPTVVTQNITVQLDANGAATITPAQINNGSTDNCTAAADLTLALDKTTFDCSNIGDNTVTLTVTDANGNSQTGTATVTVEDKIKPTVVTQNITVQLDANGAASITPAQINNGSTDNCTAAADLTLALDKTTFDCSNIGDNTVTLSVTDANGNSQTGTATVAVEDKIKPTVVTQNITVQLDANGAASITPAQINNGSTDNCTAAADLTLALDKTTFDCSNIGDNTVTLSVTDANGNSQTGTATVAVEDKIKPTVVTQNITVQLDANGSASITPAQINNGSTDNCTAAANLTLALDKTTFDCSDIGDKTVTLTVTDANGNAQTGTATVTVEDKIKPKVVTQDITVQLDASGGASITPSQINDGSTDNCSIPSDGYSLSKTTFDCSNVGANTVTLTVTDANGNSESGTATVTVEDNVKPIVHTQNITVQLDASGAASITPAQIDNGSSDNCTAAANLILALDKTTFDCSNIGGNTVTLTVTDANGNTQTGTATVSVHDVTAPVPDVTTLTAATGECSVTVSAVPTATDNCKGNITGTTTDPLTYTVQGDYIIHWNFDDGNGNVSHQTQAVSVHDITAPVPDVTILTPATGECNLTVLTAPKASDNCKGSITGTTTDPLTYTVQGTYTITWTYNDGNGNTTTQTQKVIVKDVTNPTITAPTAVIVNNDAGKCSASGVSLGTPATGDNCGVATVTNDAPPVYPVGSTTVTWTVTDIHGNTNMATQTVTVTDNEKPTITAAANVSVNNDAGQCGAAVTLAAPATGDNCGVQSVSNDHPSTTYPVGSTTVTWTVTDIHGNTNMATQTVTVTDNEKPTFTRPADKTIYTTASCTYDAGTAATGDVTNEHDNCSIGLQATFTDVTVAGACEGSKIISRTWHLADNYGNAAVDQVQTITVSDNIPPTFTRPADKIIPFTTTSGYDASPTNTGEVTNMHDNCSTGLNATYTDAVSQCGNNIVINRTWRLADKCGNAAADQVQTITVTDNNTPYVVYAKLEAKFDKGNQFNGSVGVTDVKGKAAFKKGSVLPSPYFVKAANIDVQSGSSVPNRYVMPANDGPNPPFFSFIGTTTGLPDYTVRTSTSVPVSANFKNLTINKNVTVTVTGTLYGKIVIGHGAKVTFNPPGGILNIESLQSGGDDDRGTTQILFGSSTSVRVKSKVNIGANSWVNIGGPKVIFYLTNDGKDKKGDEGKDEVKFLVQGGRSTVNANIFIKNGSLMVEGDDDARNTMIGWFIAEKVTGKENVVWNPYGCSTPSIATSSVITKTIAPLPSKLEIRVMPNPTSYYFNIGLKSVSNENLKITVVDVTGRLIEQRTDVPANSTLQIGNKYRSGIYFAEVVQGNDKIILKLIKQPE